MQDEIEFEHVSFSYGDKKVLDDLNVRFPLCSNVALVGENGAGKSTLIKLLLNLYSPQTGQILIGGQKNTSLMQKEKQGLFSVAYQDFYRYPLSLRENLSLCLKESATDVQCVEALKLVGMEKFSNQLDCMLGKFGDSSIELSDGQWQKIVLARALMSKAKMLILDEPTASLDPVSESNLYDSFMDAMKLQGTLIVTHRMALTRFADLVLVLKDGRICGMGRHEELFRRNSYYHMLYEKQSEWYR